MAKSKKKYFKFYWILLAAGFIGLIVIWVILYQIANRDPNDIWPRSAVAAENKYQISFDPHSPKQGDVLNTTIRVVSQRDGSPVRNTRFVLNLSKNVSRTGKIGAIAQAPVTVARETALSNMDGVISWQATVSDEGLYYLGIGLADIDSVQYFKDHPTEHSLPAGASFKINVEK